MTGTDKISGIVRLIAGAALAFSSSVATANSDGGSPATINGHLTEIHQKSPINISILSRTGEGPNSVVVHQHGRVSLSLVYQEFMNNMAIVDQIGKISYSNIYQKGTENEALVTQSGVGKSEDWQSGSIFKKYEGEFGYITEFRSGAANIYSELPYDVPTSTFGRPH